jgi:hypothetical protein
MTKASTARIKKRVAKKATNGTAKRNGASPYKLTAAEKQQLEGFQSDLNGKKLQLANIDVQLDDLDKQRKQLIRDISNGNTGFTQFVEAAAKERDIDIDNEPWRLKLDTMTFERSGPTPQA